MELISVVSAKSIWLMNIGELNPKGLRLFPNLTDALTELYDFDEQPDNAPTIPAAQTGIRFTNGEFDTGDGMARVSLEIYDDGLVAETAVSTDVTDKFVEHLLDWATTVFGLKYDERLLMNRLFSSEVVLRLHSPFSDRFEPLTKFSELLTNSTPSATAFRPSGITFSASSSGPNTFSIDRRINSPLGSNVFYSKAAMTTHLHLKVLAEFDDLLRESQVD